MSRVAVVTVSVLFAVIAATAGLEAQECIQSELSSPVAYFSREFGVKRHYSGELLIDDERTVRTTNSIKEYTGPKEFEGVFVDGVSTQAVVVQFGTKYEREMTYYYLVDESRACEFSYEFEGEDFTLGSKVGDEVLLRGPITKDLSWSAVSTEFLVLAGDIQMEGLSSVTTIIDTGLTVEVKGGVFDCCVVTRTVGVTDNPYWVPEFISAEPCSAYIEVSVVRTFAPGVGGIQSERCERAMPIGYPDSVLVDAVYRSELTKVERE